MLNQLIGFMSPQFDPDDIDEVGLRRSYSFLYIYTKIDNCIHL